MGGCRCTYKNCTVKTDGLTHLFHYPVFDKVRCHQWLTNAQKLEYLNLKVSQLRNRVVCQHHFTDDMFMNYLKTKLTFRAVPTEDGPYCQPTYNNTSEVAKEYSITKDDIENEYLSIVEKRANFSVKYGDFLTNSEVMDLENSNKIFAVNKQDITNNYSKYSLKDEFEDDKTVILNQNNFDTQEKPNLINVTLYPKPIVVDNNFVELTLSPINNNQDANNKGELILPQSAIKSQILPKPRRVKILSEKKISEPIKVPGKLQPISPSTIIQIGHVGDHNTQEIKLDQNNKRVNNVTVIPKDLILNVKDNDVKCINQLLAYGAVENSSSVKNYEINENKNENIQKKNKKVITNSNKSPNNSIIKSKITQERMAAIEEKRKFNMRLKDIIETCLENFDENIKSNKDSQNDVTLKTKIVNNIKESDRKSDTCLSKELQNPQEYVMASLEARIKRMEDTLLSRIDKNSQNILELRNTLNVPSSSKRRSSATQTASDEEVHKKQLYREISKYLSPEVNSMVYEELFINKFGMNMPAYSSSQRKRRKIDLDVL